MGDKTDCSNRGISLLPTAYKILSNILVKRLTPYVDEISGDHPDFEAASDPVKKRDDNGTVRQLFRDFEKAYSFFFFLIFPYAFFGRRILGV
jgi:hypothetical protein